jgi:steroid delta-isomerase-like uncharacterized protein
MKKLFFVVSFIVLFCFAVSCQDKAAMAELEKFRAQVKVEEQNKALVNRMWEAWNKWDFEALKELSAPEYLFYSPSNSTKPTSREATIEMAKTIHNGFPDATFIVEEMFAAGDKVISRYILRGTHQGEYEGVPATGNKIENSAIMITRIENGKIVEDREDWDSLSFMQQLGMELKPKEVKK